MDNAERKEVVENTTVQTLGIAALSAGVAALQMEGQLVNGIALAVVGIALLALKYWRNL